MSRFTKLRQHNLHQALEPMRQMMSSRCITAAEKDFFGPGTQDPMGRRMPVMTTIERRPKSDQTLRLAVVSELKWTPNVDARAIGVAVIDGVVTLTGHVQTSSEMVSVERAVCEFQMSMHLSMKSTFTRNAHHATLTETRPEIPSVEAVS